MPDIQFGTDGWRGVIADAVTFDSVRLVARAIARRVLADAGSQARRPHLLVGYDTRFLSREFARAAAEAMAAEGIRVGLASAFAPTPAFSYAVVRQEAAGAVVITASHNPPQYSGVKFKASFGGSAPVSFTRGVEEEIRRIRAECRVPSGETTARETASPAPGAGEAGVGPRVSIDMFDAREPWLDRLEALVDLAAIGRSGVRIALDAMYGAGQGLLAARLARVGSRVRELHAEVNPAFGGLHPEPIPAYLGNLAACIAAWEGPGLRVGFAFDGDADRVSPVDEAGQILSPHQTLALLLRHLARNRGQRGLVVKSVNIGHMVDAEARALGLPVAVTPVGFKYIAEVMQQRDALVGGEESGGFAVRGHIPERDGALIALLLLECMAATGKSLGNLVREMEAEYGPHRYGRQDLTLATLAARDRVVAALTAAPPDRVGAVAVRDVETMDGIKLVRSDQSWVMLRASGTEPLLRIYAEAPCQAEVEALLAWGRGMALGGDEAGDGTATAQDR
jgi:phosphomannomutase